MSEAAEFRRQVLADRTAMLAARGTRSEPDTSIADRMLCVAAGHHVAWPVGSIAAVRAVGFHPVPLIEPGLRHCVLGLAQIGGQTLSVLSLAALLGRPGTIAADPQTMLVLRPTPTVPALALVVDRVLGVLALHPSPQPGYAVLPDGVASDALPVLVELFDAEKLGRALAALQQRPHSVFDEAGA